MIPSAILFWGIAVASVVGALGVVFAPRASHAVMSLLVTMLALAGAFQVLGAPVIAAMQLIIYAGAVIVLFLFVVMLLDLGTELRSFVGRAGAMPVISVVGVLLFTVAAIMLIVTSDLTLPADARPGGDAASLGRALFARHVALFLLIGILLTAAADGVVGLTSHEPAKGSAKGSAKGTE